MDLISTAARRFAPNNFVTEGTTDKVGITLNIHAPQEANPLVQVLWLNEDAVTEWVRAEYLNLAI